MGETIQTDSNEIATNDFIVRHLASLITSAAHHDNLGAAITATYLAQQGDLTRNKYNLAAATSNLASYTDRNAFYLPDRQEAPNENMLFHTCTQAINRLLPGVIQRTGAEALLFLAVYKVEEGCTQTEQEAHRDFQQALQHTSRWYRPVLKGRWLAGYYREWLRKPEPTETELLGIAAARKLMKPINPVNVAEHIMEGRIFKKKKQRRASLAAESESFTSGQITNH